jgi:cysteine desulfurase / selenocysteine lyase
MFEKGKDLFPIRNRYIYLTHCGVSPLYDGASKRAAEISRGQVENGMLGLRDYVDLLDRLRSAAARLLGTSPDNLAFVKNTSEGICLVANGYPFQPGDRIISYAHEYPANHYPWRLQEMRGAELVLLQNRDISGAVSDAPPCAWSMSDLEEKVTASTRIVALSHVQFTSGFAADLKELGDFCRKRSIDLVIDAAQSLGCLPVHPEEFNISAVAASGWKWLLGPVGTGLLYTSPELRAKLGHVMVGADLMLQGTDYLDHSWNPHLTARRFEYSTCPVSLAAALEASIRDLHLRYGMENIRREVFRLQDILLGGIDRDRFTPLLFPESHRSGIISLICREDPTAVARALEREGVICSSRGGYLRLAPHFYNTDEEMLRAASLLSSIRI